MRIPYVVAPHDPYAPAVFQTNRHLKWPYWFLLERRLLRSAAAVQVLDERHGEFLRRLGVRTTPIIVAENGVTPDRVLPRTELRWSGPREPIRLLYLGRLDVHNKGLDLLISAFARLRSSSTTLTIQGPDEKHERGALEAQATELGVRDRIAFKAPDYDLMPGEIMRDHDVFCSPSRFEGFGLAALEAMLAGRVLLVSEAAGLASHVERAGCGVVVPPDVESICSGLEDLFEMREDWPAMGSAGREYALRTLQWNAIGAELLKDYERILPKPAPRLAGLARS